MAEVLQVKQVWEIMTVKFHYFHLIAMGHGLQKLSPKNPKMVECGPKS